MGDNNTVNKFRIIKPSRITKIITEFDSYGKALSKSVISCEISSASGSLTSYLSASKILNPSRIE